MLAIKKGPGEITSCSGQVWSQTPSLTTPMQSNEIKRLSKGIIIYYHNDCWAVEMTQFHPNGLA